MLERNGSAALALHFWHCGVPSRKGRSQTATKPDEDMEESKEGGLCLTVAKKKAFRITKGHLLELVRK